MVAGVGSCCDQVVGRRAGSVQGRFLHRFSGSEPRESALAYMRGLIAPLQRKNGWTLAEEAGSAGRRRRRDAARGVRPRSHRSHRCRAQHLRPGRGTRPTAVGWAPDRWSRPELPKRNPDGSGGALIRLVRSAFEPRTGGGFDDPVLPRGGQVVSRARQGRWGPEQSSEGIGEDLDVHAVAFMFPGVVRGVCGDAVDLQQDAVENDERLRPDRRHRLVQGRGDGGRDLDGSRV